MSGRLRDEFAVKPVDAFIESWRQLEQYLLQAGDELHLAIIGGGAGGVELALSLQYRVAYLPAGGAKLRLSLVTDSDRLLPGHNASARRRIGAIVQERGIEVHYGHAVDAFSDGKLHGKFTPPLAADAVIWGNGASPPDWLRDTGLELDEQGFIAVNACLQSQSHAEVFAAGDIAAVDRYPRPKSGVFAVRQGVPLARNLLRQARGQTLQAFTPQRQFLSLISSGDRYAIASRGRFALQGRWCWWLKDRIDRRFMQRFSEFKAMPVSGPETAEMAPMHCGGCGSRVGSRVLEQVLQRVTERYGIDAAGGFEQADDASLVDVPQGMQLVQSIDQFRSFIDDPW